MSCPKCGSLHVLCGSPNTAYVPGEVPKPLFRIDSCLRCGHRWSLAYPNTSRPFHEDHDKDA